MKRLLITAGALAALAFTGCQKDDSGVAAKLDQINSKLEQIEKKLASAPVGAAAPGMPQQPARPRPDPNKVYSVPVDGAPFKGPEHAKVTVVKAFEFACPYCEKVRPTLDQLQKDYGNDVKIVSKHLIVHPQVATIPAFAACAANKQGKYAQMEDLIWEKGFKAGRDLSRENMEKLAGEIGLDMERFKKDMDGECQQIVQRDQAEMRRVGASGTPAFFINGRFLSGARPIEQFKALIDEELKKANDALAKGAKLETYYTENVVQKGEKQLAGAAVAN